MTAFRCLLALLALLLGLGAVPSASAETSCTATASPIVFGSINNQAAAPTDTSMTVTITCRTSGLTALAAVRVQLCVGIGSGTASSALSPTRQLVNGSTDTLAYQLYTDAARTTPWGLLPAGSPPAQPLQLSYSAPLLGGSGTTSTVVYARVPASQVLAVGAYTSSFANADVTLSYAYNEALIGTPALPATCTSTGTSGRKSEVNSFPFTVSANVAPQCGGYLASDMDFGTLNGRLATAIDQQATLTLTCIRRTAFNVALDNGLNASGSTRRMRHTNAAFSTALIPYELYRTPARDTRWGTTVGTDTVAGTGTGAAQSITIYGRTPATVGALPVAGTYRDTVVVTVTY